MSAHKWKDGQMYKLTLKQISIVPMNKETVYFQDSWIMYKEIYVHFEETNEKLSFLKRLKYLKIWFFVKFSTYHIQTMCSSLPLFLHIPSVWLGGLEEGMDVGAGIESVHEESFVLHF